MSTRTTTSGDQSLNFFIIKYGFNLDSKGHILGEIKFSFVMRVILSKYQSNMPVTYKVITILAKFNNLTLKVKVI